MPHIEVDAALAKPLPFTRYEVHDCAQSALGPSCHGWRVGPNQPEEADAKMATGGSVRNELRRRVEHDFAAEGAGFAQSVVLLEPVGGGRLR